MNNEARFAAGLLAILLIFVLLSAFLGIRIERGGFSSPSQVASPFTNLKLVAKAAYVYDVRERKVLYVQNENARLSLASLTKLMSASLALDLAPSYSTVVVTRAAVETEGDSGLLVGEHWLLKNLLNFSLTSSSNDGIRAVALALGSLNKSSATAAEIENDFVEQMNKKANTLGMKNTYYFNETGLDETAQKGGAYGTASDIALLLTDTLIKHPEILEATQDGNVTIPSLDKQHNVKNTDTLVEYIPGVKASKTGYTDLSGGNLAVAFDPELGRPIVVVVLGSTLEGRFEDVRKLVAASLEAIRK